MAKKINKKKKNVIDNKYSYHHILVKFNRFKKNHYQCYRTILDLAKKVFEEGVESVKLSDLKEPKMLLPAKQTSLIQIRGDSIVFDDVIMRNLFIAVYLIETYIEKAWGNREQISEILRNIIIRGNKININDLSGIVLALLHNEYKKDIAEWVIEDLKNDRHFRSLYPFLQALPFIDVETKKLIDVLNDIQKATQNDLVNGQIHSALANYCRNNRKAAEVLVQELILNYKFDAAVFIPIILGVLSENDFVSIHRKSLNLTTTDCPTLVKSGILALGVLIYTSQSSCLNLTLKRYRELLKGNPGQYASAMVNGCGNLIKFSNYAKKMFVDISAINDNQVKYQTAYMLMVTNKEHNNRKWFIEALMNLSVTERDQLSTINYIDGLLYDLYTSRPEAVIQFLEKWILNHGEMDSEKKITDEFPVTFSILNIKDIEQCITRWFCNNNKSFHMAASECINYRKIYGADSEEKSLCLNKDGLDKMSNRDVIFVLEKILGYVFDVSVLCSLVFSILQRRPKEKIIENHIIAVFKDYIIYNYPEATKEFLSNMQNRGDKYYTKVAKILLKELKFFEARKSLVRLRELEPPLQRVKQFIKAMGKRRIKIFESVQTHSVLKNMVGQVPVKLGVAFFQYINGVFSEKSAFTEYSQSVFLPRSESIDPVGLDYMLLHWRNKPKEIKK